MDDSTMKLAFVNQGFDMILPPYQTSVGACTYGAACCLAKFSEVVVLWTSRLAKQPSRGFGGPRGAFPLHSVEPADHVLYKIRHKLRRLGLLTAPESSSAWSFP